MADVRLTATNPVDSSVVPVACNAKGELLLEEPQVPEFDGNVDGDLTVTGSASFGGETTTIKGTEGVIISGLIELQGSRAGSTSAISVREGDENSAQTVEIAAAGWLQT